MKTGLTFTPPPAASYQEVLSLVDYRNPSQFVAAIDREATRKGVSNNSHGTIFELAVCEVLKLEGVTPFYYQVTLPGYPTTADFDVILLQGPHKPISLSLKTTIRERWKQSAWEAKALHDIYPAAESYVVLLDAKEAELRNLDIESGRIFGINRFVVANSKEFNDFIADLQSRKFTKVVQVVPFQGREQE